jgi:hypothetical protein
MDDINMKKLFIYPLLFVLSVTVLGLGAMFYFNKDVKEVGAEFYNTAVYPPTGDNVSGFAWSENVGWISFNSSDCDSNCAGATCVSDGVPVGCPSAGTNFSNYGVNIDPVSGIFPVMRGVQMWAGYTLVRMPIWQDMG